MGQYYKPIILKEKEDKPKRWFYSWDYDNGMKLMEHSYLANNFVGVVCNQLINKPNRLVWAGDYADIEKDTEGTGYEGRGQNLYELAADNLKSRAKKQYDNKKYHILVNHTAKQFVDTNNIKPDEDGWEIHPLPLLTVEGNGRGGGDYHGENPHIGMWARDVIEVTTKAPDGYEEIKPEFHE